MRHGGSQALWAGPQPHPTHLVVKPARTCWWCTFVSHKAGETGYCSVDPTTLPQHFPNNSTIVRPSSERQTSRLYGSNKLESI